MNLFGDDVIFDEDDNEDDCSLSALPAKGLLPPRESTICLGHENQENLFLELFKKNALPHAMVFSGPQGIGKTTMAFRLARFLFKHGKGDDAQDSLFAGSSDLSQDDLSTMDVSSDDSVFLRIISGGHADFLHISRVFDASKGKSDTNIKVDAVRKIAPFMRKTASEGGWRIVIIEDADTMNRNAQNAILKILEEPPEKAMIILVAHRLGMLIPTIRSRARVINFAPLSPQIMNDLLERQGCSVSHDQFQTLSEISGGSIGSALRFAEDGGLEMIDTALECFENAPRWNWVTIHKLSTTLSSPSQDKQYRLFCDILQWIMRRALYAKLKGSETVPLCLRGLSLTKMIDEFPLERLISINDSLKQHFDRAEFSNLDRRDAVRAAFLVISQ